MHPVNEITDLEPRQFGLKVYALNHYANYFTGF